MVPVSRFQILKMLKALKSNKNINRIVFTLAVAAVGAFCFGPDPPVYGAVATDKTAVKVLTEHEKGGSTHFVVQNSELSEVTMTFDFATVNLKGDVQFPYTATFKPGATEAF